MADHNVMDNTYNPGFSFADLDIGQNSRCAQKDPAKWTAVDQMQCFPAQESQNILVPPVKRACAKPCCSFENLRIRIKKNKE